MLTMRDDQVFTREFLLFDADEYGGYRDLFYKTEIRRRHSRNFMKTFDRLIAMAGDCDAANGIITDSLAQSAHGLLYNRMREHLPAELKEEWTPIDKCDHDKLRESGEV